MKLSLKSPVRFAPRQPRAAVVIEATLLLPDDGTSPVSIMNISTEGFMGETSSGVPIDATVGVALPGCGILPAKVRWNEAGEIGAQFLVPFDLDQLRARTGEESGERALFHSRIINGPL